jgi:hypothetical protein
MNAQKLLPIKVVLPRSEDYQSPNDGGGEIKFFGEFTDSLREKFGADLLNVQNHFQQSFGIWSEMPVVAKVRLKSEATAKSHRPTELFGEETCPIIGANRLGELYISVCPNGMNALGGVLLLLIRSERELK